jgi:dTDP-4-amino-4,6-dideoxygalactose transaminase
MFRLDLGRLTCDREAFVKALQAEGAPCVAGYIPEPVYHTPAFLDGNFFAGRWPVRELGLTRMDYAKVRCPVAEEIIRTAVRVGIGENMDATYVEQVAAAVRKVARYYRKPR